MGMLGDILYPDNKEMAEELNKKYQTLLDNNTLQNNLVNSYNDVAESISVFDGYLMAVMCMQYAIAYDDEKLVNMPETDIPKIRQSIADRIEGYAITGIAVYQVLGVLNAMRKGVVNLYRNAGTYKAKIGEGFNSFKSSMQAGLERARFKINSWRSGNVSALTERNLERFQEMEADLPNESDPMPLEESEVETINAEEGTEWELVDTTVAEEAATITEGAEIAETSALAEGAAALGEAVSAVLGPAIVILVVVTEIISAVNAGEENQKLKEAEAKMDENLRTQKQSLESIRKAFANLLDCGIQDIAEYNELIKDEINLVPSKAAFFSQYPGYMPGKGFSKTSLEEYKTNVVHITSADAIGISQKNVNEAIDHAQTCIRDLAGQYSMDTQIIASIKSMLKRKGTTDITDEEIEELQDVFGVDQNRINYCNKLRIYINEIAAKLAPYHKAINDMPQKSGTATKQPEIDPINHTAPANPAYNPDPNDFQTPPA